MAFKGTHDVQSRGSRVWRQRLKVSPRQKVSSGSLLVLNTRSLKAGENTYQCKHNIHAKIDGMIEITNGIISIKPAAKNQ